MWRNDRNHAVAAGDLTIGKREIRNSRAFHWYARHGHELLGCRPRWTSPLCEIGISRRSVYQMITSREQALGEGNCARVTERGKEACECMGKGRVCRLPSERHSPLGCIFTKSARLRTETPYKAGPVRRVSQTSRSRSLSTDQVKDELVQRKFMSLSGETCITPRSKSSRRLKARNIPAKAGVGEAGVSRGRSTDLRMPIETGRAKQ